MKTQLHLRPLRAAALLILAAIIAPLHAAGPTPATRADRLNQLVTLSPAQRDQALAIFANEDADLAKLGGNAQGPGIATVEIRQLSRDRIRALLTPAQQKIWDRAPQLNGGGLNIPTPEARLATLEKDVPDLTPEQRQVALAAYTEEFESLIAIPAPERPNKGAPYRQASRNQIRDLLTPAQRAKMDGTQEASQLESIKRQTAIENALRASTGLTARVGTIVRLQMSSMSTATNLQTKTVKGSITYRVTGSTGAETVTGDWEQPAGSDAVKLTRLATEKGEAIAP